MSPSPHSSARVVVVGTLNIDHVWQVPALPRPGETMLASVVEQQFGGKGANQAVAAVRQGAHTVLVGAAGDDNDGHRYLERLKAEGVDIALVTIVARAATGAAHVYVEPKGENLIVVNPGANAEIDVTPLARSLTPADVLLVQLECPLPAVVEALRAAAAQGARTVLNASPAHRDFPWGQQEIDTVIVNEHECRNCFGRDAQVAWELSEPERRALLARHGIDHLVITQGAAATLHLSGTERMSVPTHPVVPRDTVGAGDMFAGTLAAELAAGRDWPEALRHANIAAALSTLAVGAQAAMPPRPAVESAAQQKRASRPS